MIWTAHCCDVSAACSELQRFPFQGTQSAERCQELGIVYKWNETDFSIFFIYRRTYFHSTVNKLSSDVTFSTSPYHFTVHSVSCRNPRQFGVDSLHLALKHSETVLSFKCLADYLNQFLRFLFLSIV
jgi:hypothetical protein